ncbi:hypothetical protein HYW53_02520 [Candidatus Giovannonibacteria bacterium]|nr:hypothetical protein [Candidatus Giovannonibacteria bacterium]
MRKFSKIGLALAILLTALLFWFLLLRFPLVPDNPLVYLGLGIIAICIALLSFALLFLPWWANALLVFLAALPVLSFADFSAKNLFLLVIFALFIFWPAHRLKREAISRADFSFAKIFRKGIPLFGTLASLFLALVFLPSFEEFSPEKYFPRDFFNIVYRGVKQTISTVNPTLKNLLPDPNRKIDDVIYDQISKNSKLNLRNVTEAEREIMISTARQEMSQTFAIKIEKGETAGDVYYRYSISALDSGLRYYRQYIPAFFSLAIFGLSRLIFAILGWISLVLAWILLRLGLKRGIFEFKERSLMQKYLVLR